MPGPPYNKKSRNPYTPPYGARKSFPSGAKSSSSVNNYALINLNARVNKLTSLINTEFKTIDSTGTSTAVPNAGVRILLNGLVKGDGISNRSGRKVRFKSLQLKYSCEHSGAGAQNRVRVMVVVDKQPNAAVFTVADLLEDTAIPTISPRNLDNRKRFAWLYDKSFTLNDDYPEKMFKHYRKIDCKTIFDDSDTGLVADITSNSIYMVAVSDHVTGPLMTYYHRLRFIDN